MPGLQPHRDEKVAGTFGRAARHARRPDVDEAERVHRAPDRGDDGVRKSKVPLHAPAAQIEPSILEAQCLVDVLFVELKRQRGRPREDADGVDLDLDRTGRQVRVDRLGSTCDDLALRLQDKLVPHLACGARCVGSALWIDDELDLARVIAQVDEDEAAVIATRVGPPGDGHPPADVLGPQLAAVEVTPAHGPVRVATTSLRETTRSLSPVRRSVASSPRTITIVRAPVRPACVIWPLKERLA